MKNYFLLLSLVTCSFLTAVPLNGETGDDRRPSWIERLFGAKETDEAKSEAKTEEKSAQQAVKEKAEAKEKAKAKEKAEEKAKAKEKAPREFTEEERNVLESWNKGNAEWKKSKKPLPPGLQKKVASGGELPPGWKKKLEVGAVLDAEVAEQAETIPEEILSQLPESEAGTEILRVGGEIIKVIEGTREIVDVLRGSAPRD